MKIKLLLSLVLFVGVVFGYVVYQNLIPDNVVAKVAEEDVAVDEQTEDIVMLAEDVEVVEKIKEPEKVIEVEENFAGTHIMADGTVMAGDGKPILGATILPDGNIELSNGTVITPAFDLRSKKETVPEVVTPTNVVVDMTGENFAYNVKQIKVKKGDIVTINLVSTEGIHDWVLDEFGVESERINEGGELSVTFKADKVGTFQYYCSVGTHRQKGMIGYLTVE